MPIELDPVQERRKRDLLAMTQKIKDSLLKEHLSFRPTVDTPEWLQRRDNLNRMTHFDVLSEMRDSAALVRNQKAMAEVDSLRSIMEEEHRREQENIRAHEFDASKGTLAGTVAPFITGLDRFARAALPIPFLGEGVSALGSKIGSMIPTFAGESSRKFDYDTLREHQDREAEMAREGSTLGAVGIGVAEGLGTIRGFSGLGGAIGKAGQVLKTTGKPLNQAAGRFLLSHVGNFASAEAALQLGQAGALKLNSWLYGSERDSALAGEALSQLPHATVNAGLLGAVMPWLSRAGRAVSRSLAGKWVPGVTEKFAGVEALYDIAKAANPLHPGFAMAVPKGIEGALTRTAQGFGGVVEFFPMSLIPHVGDDGITIHDPYRKILYGESEKEVREGWTQLLESFFTGWITGASRKNVEFGEPGARGMFLEPKPKDLPPEVQMALRSGAAEAVKAMDVEAMGSPEALNSILQIVAAREKAGYENPGTFEQLLNEGREKWGAEENAKRQEYHQKIEAQAKKDYDRADPRDIPVFDDRGAARQAGLLRPGMGMRTKEEARELGFLPFMATGEAGGRQGWEPSEWDPRLRRELTERGTEIEVNLGTRSNPLWVSGKILGPEFRQSEGEQHKLKGVRFVSENGEGMFSREDVLRRNVRLPVEPIAPGGRPVRPPLSQKRADAVEIRRAELKAAEAARRERIVGVPREPDIRGQRRLPLLGKPKPPPAKDPLLVSPSATGEAGAGQAPPASGRALGPNPFLTGTKVTGRRSKAPKEAETEGGDAAAEGLGVTAETARVAARAGLTLQGAGAPAGAPERRDVRQGKGAGPRGTDRRKRSVPVMQELRTTKAASRRARVEAETDALTGLGNRRHLDRAMTAMASNPSLRISVYDGQNLKAMNTKKTDVGGDTLIKTWASHLIRGAREIGLRETAVHRQGGDEFAVVGTESELRRLNKWLSHNPIGETTEINGVKYLHNLIGGEPKSTHEEASKSQKRASDDAKARSKAAGFGVFREAAPAAEAPAAEAPAAAPAPAAPPAARAGAPNPPAERQDSGKAKKRSFDIAEATSDIVAAGFPAESITTGSLGNIYALAAKARAGHKYDAEKETWVRPLKQSIPAQKPEAEASPSVEATATARETTSEPKTADDYMARAESSLLEQKERMQRIAAEAATEAQSREISSEHSEALDYLDGRIDAIRTLRSKMRRKGQTGSLPRTMTASMPTPKSGGWYTFTTVDGRRVTGIVERSQTEPGLGRRMKIINEKGNSETIRVNDIRDIAPSDARSVDLREPIEVSATTLAGMIAGQSMTNPDASRAEMAEEVERASEMRTRAEIESAKKARKHSTSETIRARQRILSGEATMDEARDEALKRRVSRIKSGELTSDDYLIEANYFLASPDNRSLQTIQLGGTTAQAEIASRDIEARRIADLQAKGTNISQEEMDAVREWTHQTKSGGRRKRTRGGAVVRWYDPKKALISKEELEGMAVAGSEQAARDLSNYILLKGKADATAALERAQSEQSQQHLGGGMRVLRGDILGSKPIYLSQEPTTGTSNFIKATPTPEGTYSLQQLRRSEIMADPQIREIFEHDKNWRHKTRIERLNDEQREEIKRKAAAFAIEATSNIAAFAQKQVDVLPDGDLYDRARQWLKDNPRPSDKDAIDSWMERLVEEFSYAPPSDAVDVSPSVGSSRHTIELNEALHSVEAPEARPVSERQTIGQIMRERVEMYRNPITNVPIGGEGTTLSSIIPGGLPGDVTRRAMRLVTRPIGASIRIGADIGSAVVGSFTGMVRDILFRADTLPGGQSMMDRDNVIGRAMRKWVHHTRKAELSIMVTGGEHGPKARTLLNQHNGEIEENVERIDKFKKAISDKTNEQLIDMSRRYTEGEAVPEFKEYDTFMREMAEALVSVGLANKGDLDRFLGRYIHYGIFKWSVPAVLERANKLKQEFKWAKENGKETKHIEEGIEYLRKFLRDNELNLGSTKYVVGDIPLERVGDPETAALVRGGYLRYRGFKSFDEAVQNGLDVSNMTNILVRSMHAESQAVAKQRLFNKIAEDRGLSLPAESAPSWYTRVESEHLERFNAWRKLDGRAVDPYLMDQLMTLEHHPEGIARVAAYVHAATKATLALTNLGTAVTNMLGNPLILAAQGMPVLTAYAEYARAFGELLISDPLFGEHATGTKYGSRRSFYVRQGWATHLSDAIREFHEITKSDRGLRGLVLRATRAGNPSAAKEIITEVMSRLAKYGDRGVRLYRLLDLAAKASLHEWNVKTGKTEAESIQNVNDLFDVEHLPKLWRGLRSGVAGTGLGAWSFTSFPAAMARSLPRIIGSSPVVMAQIAALQQIYRYVLGQIYGIDPDEIERMVDESLPVTSSPLFDKVARLTAIPYPTEQGLEVLSTTKFQPHDAVLDLVPGVRPLAYGGIDDRGMDWKSALASGMLSRSALSGPSATWLLDRDPTSGAPVRDRYEGGFAEFLREKQGFPFTLVPGLGTAFQKKAAFNRASGDSVPFVHSRVGRAEEDEYGIVKTADTGGGVSDFTDAWLGTFGLNPRRPDALQRHLERARAFDDRVEWDQAHGGFKPRTPLDKATPERAQEEASAVSKLESIRTLQRGLRAWAAMANYDNIYRQNPKSDRLEAAKIAVVRLLKTHDNVHKYVKSLAIAGELDKARELAEATARYDFLPRSQTGKPTDTRGRLLPR